MRAPQVWSTANCDPEATNLTKFHFFIKLLQIVRSFDIFYKAIMLATLCLLLAQPQTIDLELRASRLPVLVEALEQKLNERLFCSPELGRHVVLVRFTGVSPAEVKAKIAEAVDAEWVDRNGTLTLLRTAAKQRALTTAWHSMRERSASVALAEFNEQLAKYPKFDLDTGRKLLSDLAKFDQDEDPTQPGGRVDWQQQGKAHARAPGGRAIIRLLNLMGASELASIPVGRTVYATNPTRLQKPLPNGLDAILRSWDQEEDVWRNVLEAAPQTRPDGGSLSSDPRFAKYAGAKPYKVLLIAQRYGPRANINFSLQGYDSAGEVQFSSSVDLHPGWSVNMQSIQNAVQVGTAKGTYELSPESQTRLSFSSLEYESDARPDPEWVKVLADPVARDPLSFELSEVLLEIAKVSKSNMVASLNDAITLPTVSQGVKAPINLEGVLKYNELMGHIDVERDGNWIQIKPTTKYGPPALPDDRFAAKRLIQSGLQNGYFTIQALADFSQNAEAEWNAVAFYLSRMLLPRSERILQDMEYRGLRFFGALSLVQQKSLMNGEPVPLNTLSESAQQRLLHLALQLNSHSAQEGLFVEGQNTGMRLHNSLSAEPTEFLAKPFGGDSVRPEIKSEDELLIGTKNGKYVAWSRLLKPEQFGRALEKGDGVYSREDDLWTGATVSLKLVVPLAPETELRFQLKEHRYDLRRKPLKLDQMPPDIRKRIDSGG